MNIRTLLALITLLLGLATARAADQDFTLVNKTGFEIHTVFISPHRAEDWQEDVLGRATLGNGEFVEIKFARDTKSKLWDLKVTDKDGKGYVWENINLLEVSKVTVIYKDGAASAAYE